MTGISDRTMQAVHYALSGLATRAEVRAANVANAETPGYQARSVDFESALAAALDGDDPSSAGSPAVGLKDNLPDIHGNTVELEQETIDMMSDDILYEAMVNAWNAKARNLRLAMGGQS